tara:strand:+ start:384 stop:1043 length:660 start_codon:yes stop_codon:yes gene_type:complete
MDNNISYIQPFSIPMVQVKIDEDTSELKSYDQVKMFALKNQEKAERISNSYNRHNDKNWNDKFRILEKYPTTKNLLTQYVNKILGEGIGYDANFAISTSWMTLTSKGFKSQLHNHKNSFWSGVYYFDDNYSDHCGNLELRNPINDLSDFQVEFKKLDSSTNPFICVVPISKCLVLFPSYIYHGIQTNHDANDRFSLAFNIVPTGYCGEADASYDTNWFN